MKRAIATIPLDFGKCPRWLFERMVKLSRSLIEIFMKDHSPEAFLERLADPVWFQSLNSVLGFDWNSSGSTTLLTAALKEATRGQEEDFGIFICGGKGRTSRKTPQEIENFGQKLSLPSPIIQKLVYNSKMAAKVDSALVQDGYQLYHHAFFFTKSGTWAVIQQGMNPLKKQARRYHWFSPHIKDLVQEPHFGIVTQKPEKLVLDLTAKESSQNREISRQLVNQSFYSLMKDFKLIDKYSSQLSKVLRLGGSQGELTLFSVPNLEFKWHPVLLENFYHNKYLQKMLWRLCEAKPNTYEELLAFPGVGPKTIRALALVAEVIYGAKPSYEDPARYSFAVGGKDGTPYPLDLKTYDQALSYLQKISKKVDF